MKKLKTMPALALAFGLFGLPDAPGIVPTVGGEAMAACTIVNPATDHAVTRPCGNPMDGQDNNGLGGGTGGPNTATDQKEAGDAALDYDWYAGGSSSGGCGSDSGGDANDDRKRKPEMHLTDADCPGGQKVEVIHRGVEW